MVLSAAAAAADAPASEATTVTMRARWLPGLFSLSCLLALLAGATATAQPIPGGSSQRTVDVGGIAIEVFTYKPRNYAGGPLLLVLHGLGRDAERYRDHAIPIADALGYVIAAPLFDTQSFPQWRYQWAGIARRIRAAEPANGDTASPLIEPQAPARWLDAQLRPLIESLRSADGQRLPYALLGHSAGAQALLRWAAFAPSDAMRIVVANPGTWLLPTPAADFPYGFGGLSSLPAGDTGIAAFLARPIVVLLGQRDLSQVNLQTGREAMQQGDSRLARGRKAFAAAQLTAQSIDMPLAWQLLEVPESGHSARRMFASAQALQALALPRRPDTDPGPDPGR